MPDRDGLAERGRSLEDDYFRKQDKQLVEKLRQAAVAEETRKDLTRQTGLRDPALVDELQALGFTPATVGLLPLVPLIQLAWAEGGITRDERRLIVDLARKRGIEEDGEADRQLTAWMTTRPTEAEFAAARRLIRAMLDSETADLDGITADELVAHCEAIAGASGGILGLGRVSAEEHELIAAVAADLQARRP